MLCLNPLRYLLGLYRLIMNRITDTFAAIRSRKKVGLFPFLTVGFPDLEATLELVPALVEAGADGFELGVPFSDPLADGAIIQNSSFKALQQGVTLQSCLDVVKVLRAKVPKTPLVLMGYYNPIFRYGIKKFAASAEEVGLDGVIVADLPPDESGPLLGECITKGISLIYLLAPTSTEERIGKACNTASGFIYCVSLTGVTGAREELPVSARQLLRRVRAHTELPLALGFGISRRKHIESIAAYADAAIVGSALMRILMDSPRHLIVSKAAELVRELSCGTPMTQGDI